MPCGLGGVPAVLAVRSIAGRLRGPVL